MIIDNLQDYTQAIQFTVGLQCASRINLAGGTCARCTRNKKKKFQYDLNSLIVKKRQQDDEDDDDDDDDEDEEEGCVDH